MDAENKTCLYFEQAFRKMDLMRKSGLFCDVILITKTMKISAHKLVLASSSDFFSNSFVKMGECSVLNLEWIEEKVLLNLIDYIYTSSVEIKIDLTTIQDLLTAANFLQLKNVVEECRKYLENQLSINTSLKIFSIAKNQKWMDLLEKSETFIDKNIKDIINTSQFLDLPYDELTHLISKDTLDISSEEKVYEGVISWLKNDLTTRTKHLGDLMSHIRFTLISKNYLAQHVISEPLILNDLKCNNLIIYALLTENIPQIIKPKEQKRGDYRQTLLVMGGNNTNNNKEARATFEFYDFKTNSRSQTYSISVEKNNCSLAVINQQIYVVSENDVAQYDLVKNHLGSSIKMSLSRPGRGVGVLNNCIYVVGGDSGGEELSSVEKFDISSQTWSSVPSLLIGRYFAGVGILNGLLYVIGGRSFHDNCNRLRSVEFYNPKLNVWKRSPDLITGRSAPAVGILHNKMYVIGGFDGNKTLNSVECFSPDINKFIESASLNIPRSGAATVEFDDKLYVIGGSDGKNYLGTIEVYYPKINKWELLPHTMNVARWIHGAAIVNKIFEI